jgi:hypothetical protein
MIAPEIYVFRVFYSIDVQAKKHVVELKIHKEPKPQELRC